MYKNAFNHTILSLFDVHVLLKVCHFFFIIYILVCHFRSQTFELRATSMFDLHTKYKMYWAYNNDMSIVQLHVSWWTSWRFHYDVVPTWCGRTRKSNINWHSNLEHFIEFVVYFWGSMQSVFNSCDRYGWFIISEHQCDTDNRARYEVQPIREVAGDPT